MSEQTIKLGIVGVGKIVRDQHLPAIANVGGYELVATASRNASVDKVASYKRIEEMLDASAVSAVALCMPPQYRFDAAVAALRAGKHVLLEKPPGATVVEVEQLMVEAQRSGVSLYATWHSRHAAAVEPTKSLLSEREVEAVRLTWKESVRKWHPGQEWIWQAGGLGVFDPGINGLSILTTCLPEPVFVTAAELSFPENKAAPITASMQLRTASGVPVMADYDWDIRGDEQWQIEFKTRSDTLVLSEGGARLNLNGESQAIADHSPYNEYEAIYNRFKNLIQTGSSDVDLTPLKLVADAFLLGERHTLDPFYENS